MFTQMAAVKHAGEFILQRIWQRRRENKSNKMAIPKHPEDSVTYNKVIPHSSQRYPTAGDYYYSKTHPNQKTVVASDTGNAIYNWLIQIHEDIESRLCQFQGIPEPDCAEFDMRFEENREKGLTHGEPGFHSTCMYRKAHTVATIIEMILCDALGENWQTYSETVDALP